MTTNTEAVAPRVLRRTSEGRVIAGVAAGLARYFGIDPVIVRIAFVVLSFPAGIGVPLYLLAWIFMPMEGAEANAVASRAPSAGGAAKLFGGLLIVLGALLTIEILEPSWIDGRYVGPAVLILLGLGLVARGTRD